MLSHINKTQFQTLDQKDPEIIPQLQYISQSNQQKYSLNQADTNIDRYSWMQRKDKLKWGIAESIDIDQIVRHGDLRSVLFYMNQFVEANIGRDDCKKFGTKGALNLFLIMQLGSEYLINENKRLEETNINLVKEINAKIDTINSKLTKQNNIVLQYKSQNEELKKKLKIKKRSTKLEEQNKENSQQISNLNSKLIELEKQVKKFKKISQILNEQKNELEEELANKNIEIEKFKSQLQKEELSPKIYKPESFKKLEFFHHDLLYNFENLGEIGHGNSSKIIKLCQKSSIFALKIMKNINHEES